jgi:hypothetical protein
LLVKDMDFAEAAEAEDVSDEHNCLGAIMQRQVRVDYDGMGSTTRSIGELVAVAASGLGDASCPSGLAHEVLHRHGLRVESGRLWVANNHLEIAKALRDTPWASGHARLLLRIEGAAKGDKAAKFAGATSRYVSVPIS